MIYPEDIEPELEQRHRDTILDLVLAWGFLDGALGMMLARILGATLPEGAELIGKMPSTARFAEMRRLLLTSPNGAEVASSLKRHKKAYERYTRPRNLIAHSHCAGIWKKDGDYVVFATFERVGTEELAIDAVPLDEMRRAISWGKAMTRFALTIADTPQA